MQVPGARDVAVEFFTMSKSYNMAGWRIGFMVGNKDLVHALARIKSYHDYGSFHADPGGLDRRAGRPAGSASRGDPADLREAARNVMVKALHDAGWMVEKPKASMYIWSKIPEFLRQDGLDRVHQAA